MNKISTEYMDFINKYDWRYSITLTFSKDLSTAKNKDLYRKNSILIAKSILRTFAIRLNRSVYGRRSKKMIEMIPVMEFTAQGRPHFHVLMKSEEKISDEDLKEKVMYYWCMNGFTSTGYHKNPVNADWFQVIESDTHHRVSSYNTKDVWLNTTDAVIVDYLYPKEHNVWKKHMSKFK